MTSFIDYSKLIDQSMRSVVREALSYMVSEAKRGEHYFYISFATDVPGVKIAERIKNQYPKEMTIVLQHQFSDLTIDQEQFSVCLSFNGIVERLVIPFKSITTFTDPSVKLMIKFTAFIKEHNQQSEQVDILEDQATKDKISHLSEGNVIRLDQFRSKKH